MADRNVEKIIRKCMDKRDDKLVDIIQRSIRKGHDYEKMKERVGDYLGDAAGKKYLIETLSETFPQFARRRKHKFEETKTGVDEMKEKMLKLEEKPLQDDEPLVANAMRPVFPADIIKKIEKSDEITKEELRSKELMYKAQMAIEERKRLLNLTARPGIVAQSVIAKASKLNTKEASMFMSYSMEKLSRVQELKERLAHRTAMLTKQVKTDTDAVVARKKPVEEESDIRINEFLDPRIRVKPSQRKLRPIVFHEKGEFEKQAQRERAKARLQILQSEITQIAKKTGLSSSAKLAMLAPSTSMTISDIPEVEWWDEVVLGGKSYDAIPDAITDLDNKYQKTVTNLVEHPIQLKPPDEPLTPQYLKVYLTSRERKKIRRQNRKEAQKEQTEKIRLGLIKAPEPKVKLSNLMRVLGSEAVQDPTKVEAHVRKQVADRQRKHETANQQRKLTKEQRTAKKARKYKEDTSLSVHVALYKIKSLAHPGKRFKVEMNAKQLQMTGMILLHNNVNLVVVEGGPKQQKTFKNLMMSRIKWGDEIIGQRKPNENKSAPGERNECTLVWEGITKQRVFNEVKCVTATLEKQAREVLETHDLAHFWDLAYSTSLIADDAAT